MPKHTVEQKEEPTADGENITYFHSHRDGDVVLRDGSTVRVRVMRAADEPSSVNWLKRSERLHVVRAFKRCGFGTMLLTQAANHLAY